MTSFQVSHLLACSAGVIMWSTSVLRLKQCNVQNLQSQFECLNWMYMYTGQIDIAQVTLQRTFCTKLCA